MRFTLYTKKDILHVNLYTYLFICWKISIFVTIITPEIMATKKSSKKANQTAAEAVEKTKSASQLRRERKNMLETIMGGIEPSNSSDYLSHAAHVCRSEGWAEADVVRLILSDSPFELEEEQVTAIVHRAYQDDMSAWSPSVNDKQREAMRQLAFLDRRYEFRRNVVTGMVEYRERKRLKTRFVPVGKVELNSIALDAHSEGIDMWDRDVKRYVDSNRVMNYWPFDDFLATLPAWDGKEHIEALFARVPTTNGRWPYFAHLWFVGMVALWQQRDTKHGNELMPLLIGGQDTGKSAFCRMLLPPALEDYYTDDVTLDTPAEMRKLLHRFGLLNIDEIDRIQNSRVPMVKNLIQLPRTTMRKPHSEQIEHRPRYASFIGTTNEAAVLSDLTGTRRFLCVRIADGDHIDVTTPIDYGQLYAQAMAELKAGFRYWLTKDEEQELETLNAPFRQVPALAEEIAATFTIVPADDPSGRWYNASEIMRLAAPQKAKNFTNKDSKTLRFLMEEYFHAASIRKNNGLSYWLKISELSQ